MTLTKEYSRLVSTPVFRCNYESPARVKVNQGGTSSGKTYSILQVILLRLLEKARIATVAGQDIPNLKAGALRDFEDRILPSCEDWMGRCEVQIESYNKTERTWRFTNGSLIEFKSYKDAQDAKNGKRDILFVNEANGVAYEVYNQLAMRTSEEIFIDYNPTTSFWVHENLIGQPEVVVFYSNFSHNPFADPEIIKHVRTYKERDPESWRVYGLGKTGNIKGLIFRSVNWIDEMPKNLKKRCYGLDFGFTNDPTALCEIGELHGDLYGRELIYSLGMTNQDISRELKTLGISQYSEIFADSAEPKSIAELKADGWNVIAAVKGADSVKHGIDLMKQYRWNITASSINWKREQANYKWQEKDGIPFNKPIDNFNHLWDAGRYATVMKWGNIRRSLPQII